MAKVKQYYPGVAPVGDYGIMIDFTYEGERCRETLKIAPTSEGQRKANTKRKQILSEIALGTFDYAAHFPNSKRGKKKTQGSALSATSLTTVCKAWLASRTDLKGSTLRAYKGAIMYWTEEAKTENGVAWGALDIRDITVKRLREWVSSQQDEKNPARITVKTIRNKLIPLSAPMALAVADGLLDFNAVKAVLDLGINKPQWEKIRAQTNDDIDPFDVIELEALLTASEGAIHRYILAQAWTGLRTGEMYALAYEDLDFINKVIHVRRTRSDNGTWGTPKTDNGVRDVVMLPWVEQALREQMTDTYMKLPYDCGPYGKLRIVFYNPNTDKPFKLYKHFLRPFKRVCREAEVRYRYGYQLRHTYGSMCMSLGIAEKWIADQMGHSDVTMIRQHYGKWKPRTAQIAGTSGESQIVNFFDAWQKQKGVSNAGEASSTLLVSDGSASAARASIA